MRARSASIYTDSAVTATIKAARAIRWVSQAMLMASPSTLEDRSELPKRCDLGNFKAKATAGMIVIV